MKRFVIFALIFTIMPFMAMANVPDSNSTGNNSKGILDKYEVCEIESCYTPLIHAHGERPYLPHNFTDGHSYHQQCDVYYCNYTFVHAHNGKVFFPKA